MNDLDDKFEKEHIPDDAILFRRISKDDVFSNGKIKPSAFKVSSNHKGRVSADWNKYSTPEQTIERGGDPLRRCCSVAAGDVRKNDMIAQHDPEPYRAHSVIHSNRRAQETDVFEDLTPDERMKLAESAALHNSR